MISKSACLLLILALAACTRQQTTPTCTSSQYKVCTGQPNCFSWSCGNCDSSCKTCQNAANQCKECNPGYFFETSTTCKMCDSNCKTCYYSATQCTDCYAPLALQNEQCGGCNPTCDTCQTSNNQVCTNCKTGRYLASGKCNLCTSPCIECTSATSCSKCADGYFLSAGKCVKCNSLCATCLTAATDCPTCSALGYSVPYSYNICSACDASCKSCQGDGPKQCTSCQYGFFLTPLKACMQCDVGCANCVETSSKCDACSSRYVLQGTTCVPCSQNCFSCTSSTNCDYCIMDYYLKDGKCVTFSESLKDKEED